MFSVAAGLAVGNLYWAQPLLTAIAEDFGTSSAQGGYLVTATQLGYFCFAQSGAVWPRFCGISADGAQSWQGR